MPRPRKQTVDWFPHYVTNGKTKFVLRSRFGMAGIGAWWNILELLCRTPGHAYYCVKSLEWQFLVAEMGLSEVETEEFIKCLVDLEAIDADLWSKRVIWCQHLVDEIGDAYKNRNAKLPIKPGDNPAEQADEGITTSRNGITRADNPQTTRQDTTLQDKRLEEVCLSSDEVFEVATKEKIQVSAGEIEAACEKYTPEWVKESLKIAGDKRKQWGYVAAVLKTCLAEGHAPGQKRPQATDRASPTAKYTNGKFSHLVNR